ncbi:MAG TPA: HAMP domain-containing sensor histidine kinase [Acidobacteriaceae bacterium]|jgi:signal transduction histidine kinase|nr:HAMP domain-containing sensor histidine kinase [Acidobacteriaceae bacterium]
MHDDYQVPAIALIAALMLAFAYLHSRFRSVRTLLWMLALACTEIQAVLLWMASNWTVPASGGNASAVVWLNVAGQSALVLSSALFLASLSPVSFQIGQRRVLFVVPYIIPILIYSVLYYGVSQQPSGAMLVLYCLLAYSSAAVAFIWSLRKEAIPIWLVVIVVVCAGIVGIPQFSQGNVYWPLLAVESFNMLMTALLVVSDFRRFSPGVVLAVLGFLASAVPPIFYVEPGGVTPTGLILARAVTLGKVVLAMGLILLVLEDEVEKNEIAGQRERRVRLELEAYARQALTARSLDEFDREASRLCSMIVEHSRFSAAAMVVRSAAGGYTLVGYAGMDGATAGALDALALRMPLNCFSVGGQPLVADSTSLNLNLAPWLTPGDDLERLRLTRVGAVPLLGPDNFAEGALLLTGPRVPVESLRADDLLPLEILAGRLQAARAQALMLGKLIDSERFAGVGQLANNVAQQLNNPLTVILGYSSLLEESTVPGADRRGAEAISVEAGRMKAILERLSRFSKLSTERFNSFSVSDVVSDIEQMHRTDFLRHSIEFRLTVEPELPQVFGNAHQIRQALLHATQYAIDAVLRVDSNKEKSIRIEATLLDGEEKRVRIAIAHSGPGFVHPERAFDSLASGFAGSESTSIGLSLCAAIVREHRGHIAAVNYEPTGAAVIFDLPTSA